MNEYDRLNQLIKDWTKYVSLHRTYARGKHMAKAWHERMDKLEQLIKKLKKDRANL